MTQTLDFELTRDEQGRWNLKRAGQDDVADVRVRRAFPWSRADAFISIRTKEGKELILIEDLASISAAQRNAITHALTESVFIPQIQRVDDIDMRFGHQQWKVQTDRGPIEFRVQEREDVRFLHDGRFSIKDADGNVYELPPLGMLDEHSRQVVETLL